MNELNTEGSKPCPKCKNSVFADTSFCPECGFPVYFFKVSDGRSVDESHYVSGNSRSLKANRKIVNECSCEICSENFEFAQDIIQCLNCFHFYHKSCWQKNVGCNQDTCIVSGQTCANCGQQIQDTKQRCKYCSHLNKDYSSPEKAYLGKVKGASASLTFALIGLVIAGVIFGSIAVYHGFKALKIIQNEPGYQGKGIAITGVIIGFADILFFLVLIYLFRSF